MANELARDDGISVSLFFTVANVAGGPVISIVDGILAGANGKNGMIVPTGYAFHPMLIDVEVNDARTAGTAIFKATKDGVELTSGPTATLNASNTTQARGVQRAGPDPIAAGEEVGVSSTGDISWAPDTSDADVILVGILLPV